MIQLLVEIVETVDQVVYKLLAKLSVLGAGFGAVEGFTGQEPQRHDLLHVKSSALEVFRRLNHKHADAGEQGHREIGRVSPQ